jgi:hypothetical protein
VAEVTGMLENAVEFPEALLPDLSVDRDESALTPEEAAREARQFFGVGPGPIQHVVSLAERAGVVVVFSEPGIAGIDAYSLHTATRPIIVLNPVKDDYYRQRFDVAHELGHLIMHHDAEPGGKVPRPRRTVSRLSFSCLQRRSRRSCPSRRLAVSGPNSRSSRSIGV